MYETITSFLKADFVHLRGHQLSHDIEQEIVSRIFFQNDFTSEPAVIELRTARHNLAILHNSLID